MRNATKILAVLLVTSCLLCTGCLSPTPGPWDGVNKSLGALANRVGEIKTDVGAVKAELAAKIDADLDKLEAAGADTSSAAALAKWGAQNPATAFTLGGSFLSALAALGIGYKRKKRAVETKQEAQADAFAATVDAIEALPAGPEKDKLLAEISSHPRMYDAASAAINEVRNR